ncbi:hypothetical protein RDABS01_008542 [Bienertia sinuspersici]
MGEKLAAQSGMVGSKFEWNGRGVILCIKVVKLDSSSVSWIKLLNMAHKRPFDDEVVDEGSSKHQKQEGPNVPSDEMKLFNDSLFVEGAAGKPYEIGESSIGNDELELRQVHEKGSCPVIPRELVEEVESDAPRSASLSYWATSSTSDDDEQLEELVQLPFYPGYSVLTML